MSQTLNRNVLINLPTLKNPHFNYYYLKVNEDCKCYYSENYNLFELLSIWLGYIGVKSTIQIQLDIAEKFRNVFKLGHHDPKINNAFVLDCEKFPKFVDEVLLPILEEAQKKSYKNDNITVLSI